MPKRRRKRIFVRQSLASREGKTPPRWSAGYWDGPSQLHADDAFRVFATFDNESEAIAAAKFFSQTRSKEFIYG